MKLINNLFIFLIFSFVSVCFANAMSLKLPYTGNESYVISRGYNTPDTHVGKDKYAIDFGLNGCEIFDKPVLATFDGIVIRAENWHRPREIKSYGNMVVIDHSGNIFSLYGHLNTVKVKKGDTVKQGEQIGTVGNTGSCIGDACASHPGAHLHFTMYQEEKYADANGRMQMRKIPYKPEPMSGFSVFTVWKYYKSDNGLPEEPEDKPVEVASETIEQKPKESGSSFMNKLDIKFRKEDHTTTIFGIPDPSTFGVPKPEIDLGKIKIDLSGFRIDENEKIVRIESTANNGSVGSASVEKKKELSFEEKYNAKLAGREIAGVRQEGDRYVASPGSEISIGLGYKNTGAWDWDKKNVSLNITDPGMSIFYDNWLTKKRPVAVSQNLVKSGAGGDFSFRIRVPKTFGFYKFGVRPVVFYENDFHWLGSGEAFWNIEVREEEENKDNAGADGNVSNGDVSIPQGMGTGGNPNESEEDPVDGKDKKTGEDKGKNVNKHIFGGSEGISLDAEKDFLVETYLSSFPSEHTNTEPIVFSFNSNFSEAKFKCRMDADDFAGCSSPATYDNLAEGGHVFETMAFVDGKEDTTPAKHDFEVDRTAPAKVQDLEADSPEKGVAYLSGTLSEDELPKIKVYYKKSEDCSKEARENIEEWGAEEILLEEDAKEKSSNRFELSLKGLEEGENYCFAVKTEDLAGNVSELSNIAEAIINNSADHLVISEIKLYGENKFVELYNPTDKDENLSEYSLQFLEEGANKTVKIDFAEGGIISSHGFFLVADANSFKGTVPDLSGALPQLSGKAAIYFAKTAAYLLDKENGIENLDAAAIIDGTETAPSEDAGWSLERKAHPDSTSELMIAVPHKYDGNGYDSDSSGDFVTRRIPQPQTSASIKEPHRSQKPAIKTPVWNGEKYFAGEGINLKLEVADFEDGTVADGDIVWYLDGKEAGRGTGIGLTKWIPGRYDIFVEATDSDGEKTSGAFFIEIVSSGWSGAAEISGTDDAWAYGADMDEEGTLHVAYFQQSWDNEYNCISSIYYQKKEGDSFSQPAEIIRVGSLRCYDMNKIDLKADDRGIVHIFYMGRDYDEANYRAYYANSSDNFKQVTPVFQDLQDIQGIYDAKFQVEGGSVYITAIDHAGWIYYKKLSISGSSIQIVRESSYKTDAAGITSYDFSVKDDKLYFVVLYGKENADYIPRQFTEGLPINPVYYIYKDSWVAYLEVGDADWSFDVLDGEFYHNASIYIQGGSSSYILVNDSMDASSLLFVKQGNIWYRDDLDIKWKKENGGDEGEEYVIGFNRYADGKFHIVSLSRSHYPVSGIASDIFWYIYGGDNLRKVGLFQGPEKNIASYDIAYVHNAGGKEGILFSSDMGENEPYKLYHLER